MRNPKTIIGRIESVDFPALELFDIEGKIDTGAFTSSIHCHDIKESPKGTSLWFKLLDPSHPNYSRKKLKFKKFTKTIVKSSDGVSELRYKIRTTVRMGEKTYKTSFTLTDRSSMKYPVLVGREVLRKRYLVDVTKKYLLKTEKQEI